jgi:hypothetical protein
MTKSWVEDHFFMVYDDRGKRVRGRCRYCSTTIRASNSSNYIHHMSTKHSDKVKLRSSPRKRTHSEMSDSLIDSATAASGCSDHSRTSASVSNSNSALTKSRLGFQSVSSSRLESFRKLTVQLFSEFSFPHHLLESKLFQLFLMEFEQIKLPIGEKLSSSRKTHRKLVISQGKHVFEQIIHRLSVVARPNREV